MQQLYLISKDKLSLYGRINRNSEHMQKNRGSLSDQEKNILLRCLQRNNPKLISKLDLLGSKSLDKDSINKMKDAVGSELQEKGFNSDWEPNEYGLQLEYLIDKLSSICGN
jgi:hypothetical protein